jgi:hypothetical protein
MAARRQDAGHGLASGGRDDAGDLVADELVVGDTHPWTEDRQSTSAQSQFLDACRSRNRGELDAAQLAEVTVRLGFANVIDAFEVCSAAPSMSVR